MIPCLFASDLHGRINRYEALFESILEEEPAGVFLGGDLLPSGLGALVDQNDLKGDFLTDYLIPRFENLQSTMGSAYPEFFLILGNVEFRRVNEFVSIIKLGLHARNGA